MTSKLNYLTNISLKRKIKTKWFVIANVILALLIIGVTNIDSIINLFGGDFNNKTNIYVIDETNVSYDIFETELKNTNSLISGSEESNYNLVKTDKSKEELIECITKIKSDFIYILTNDNGKRRELIEIIPGYCGILFYGNPFGLGNLYMVLKEPQQI